MSGQFPIVGGLRAWGGGVERPAGTTVSSPGTVILTFHVKLVSILTSDWHVYTRLALHIYFISILYLFINFQESILRSGVHIFSHVKWPSFALACNMGRQLKNLVMRTLSYVATGRSSKLLRRYRQIAHKLDLRLNVNILLNNIVVVAYGWNIPVTT